MGPNGVQVQACKTVKKVVANFWLKFPKCTHRVFSLNVGDVTLLRIKASNRTDQILHREQSVFSSDKEGSGGTFLLVSEFVRCSELCYIAAADSVTQWQTFEGNRMNIVVHSSKEEVKKDNRSTYGKIVIFFL